MSADHGRFVWYDLMSPDPEASIAFYADVIGWSTQPFEIPDMPPYTMWVRGETPLGGLVPMGDEEREQGIPPHWLSYVSVPDVDAAAARVEELGGTVCHPPTDIPTVGRFTVIQDPQGAVLSLYTSAQPQESMDPEAPVGAFSWHELMTSDYEGALTFYTELFGWKAQDAMDMGGGAMYQMYGRSDEPPLGGMANQPPEMEGPPCWIYYIRVADLDAAVARIEAGGGQVVNGPMEVPGGDRIVQALDPHGAFFALHQSAS